MSLDSYLNLGRSGLRVSPMCLGAMTFGDDTGIGVDTAAAEAMLAAYLDRGGNFIDTANFYSNGHSEKIIGDHLAERPGLRDRIVLASKFFCNLHAGDPNGGGAGRKAILDQLHDTLRRLQTDYLDLYWLHNYDPFTPVEETLRTLDDLVASGKVRYIGFSNTPGWFTAKADTIAALRGWTRVTALQVEYSLLARTVEGELLPLALDAGMGVLPYSPLRGGFLSGRFRRGVATESARTALVGGPTEGEYDVIDAVVAVADEIGATPAAVALAWVLQRPAVTSPILGASRVEQLDANLAALDLTLDAEHVAVLDKVSSPTLNYPADLNRDVAPMLQFSGATVNGVTTQPYPLLTASDRRY
jgi:aryl-alcohol dehydrogenase-like predicted oxidoreductase